MLTLSSNSEIKINLPDISEIEIARIQDCFAHLLDQKFFLMGSGTVTMNFSDGELMDVWVNEKRWKKPKLDKFYK